MTGTNYGKLCESVVSGLCDSGLRPTLLLHACCAPCSSAVLEYLDSFFDITVFFFNPNIAPFEEYQFRLRELERFLAEVYGDRIGLISPEWDHGSFLDRCGDLSHLPEGGERCTLCYGQRLEETAKAASLGGFEYFCTTLSVSPYKDPVRINELGREYGERYGVRFLPSDFKKKNGYARSVELSKRYGLYRQNYCGCPFSKRDAENKENRG